MRRTYYLLGLLSAIVILLAIHGVFNIYETGRSNVAESETVLSALAFSDLVDAISKKEFYGFGYEGFIYNITVIQSNNMSVEVSKDGFLSIHLENKGDERIYEDFEWVIHGYKLENFPEKFQGFIEPRSRIEIYRAYLPMILTKPGVFKVTIVSSEELTFNVVLSSESDGAKVKELISKLAPILTIEYDPAKPQELRVRLPRYSLSMVIEVEPNPEELRPYQVIDKPWFIDVEVEKGIEVILQRIDDPKVRESFAQRWGGKNVTVIMVYINNRGNKTLSILDWGSYDISVLDPYKGELGGCGVKALVIEPFRIDVEPGQRRLLIDFIVEYVDGELYINGGGCGPKLEPGKYIFKIGLSTDPSITITMVMNLESER